MTGAGKPEPGSRPASPGESTIILNAGCVRPAASWQSGVEQDKVVALPRGRQFGPRLAQPVQADRRGDTQDQGQPKGDQLAPRTHWGDCGVGDHACTRVVAPS